MKEFYSKNLSDTDAIAAEIASLLKPGDVLALYGEMGAGKTAFVRGLVKALCPECLPLVHSPTFAIVNEYEDREQRTIFHFDFYRIKSLEEVYNMGYEEYVYSDAFCFMEWPELIEELLPEETTKVYIEENSEGEREVRILLND